MEENTAAHCWAPKLSYKAQAIASGSLSRNRSLKPEAVAAEIGWIETSLPGAAAGAIRAVESLLLGRTRRRAR